MNFLIKMGRLMFDIDPRIDYLTGNEDLDSLLELEVLKEKIPNKSFHPLNTYYRGNLEFLPPASYNEVLHPNLLIEFYQRDAINIARCLAYKFLGMKHKVYYMDAYVKCPGSWHKPVVYFRFGLPYSFHRNQNGNFIHWVVDIVLNLETCYDKKKEIRRYNYVPGECMTAYFYEVEVEIPTCLIYIDTEVTRSLIKNIWSGHTLLSYELIENVKAGYSRFSDGYKYEYVDNPLRFVFCNTLKKYQFLLQGRYFKKLDINDESKCYLRDYELMFMYLCGYNDATGEYNNNNE